MRVRPILLGAVALVATAIAGAFLVISAPRPAGLGSTVSPSPISVASAEVPLGVTATPLGVTATESASATSSATTVPSPDASVACTIRRAEFSTVAPTIENVAGVSLLAVVGQVVTLGEPRWNTPDGSRPGAGRPPGGAQIYRTATIKTTSVIRVEDGASKDVVVVRLLGGKIGCDEYSAGNTPSVKEGKPYAFFLNETFDVGGSRSSELGFFAAWPIDPSTGLVETPLDGPVSIATIVRTFDSIPHVQP